MGLDFDSSIVRRSKALKAFTENNLRLKLHHLVEAQDWSSVHEMLFHEGFAAELYFDESEETLMSVLTKMEAQSFAIPKWLVQGGLLYDYFNLEVSRQNLVQNLNETSAENIDDALANIKDSYALILKNLPAFPVNTDRMRFLIAEVSESVVAAVNACDMVIGNIRELPLFTDQVIAQTQQMANMSVKALSSNGNEGENEQVHEQNIADSFSGNNFDDSIMI